MTDNSQRPVQERHLTDSQQVTNRIEKILNPEPIKADEAPPEQPEVETEEAEVEPEAPEVETEEEAESEVADTEAQSDTSFESLDEIAEALGLDLETFLDKYKIKAKVDGEEIETSLKETREGYQRLSDYRKKTAEVAELRKAAEAEVTAQKADLQGRLTQVNGLIDNLQNQLLGEFQGINWNELRVQSPGEYAALLQDFQSRQLQLQQVQQAAKTETEKLQKEQAEKQQALYAEVVQKERQLLFDAIPEWKDSNVMKTEAEMISKFLKDRGFNEQEIGMAVDHRIIKMAYDLMKFDKTKAKAETVKNKVKTLPKLVKPGSKNTQLTGKQAQDMKLKAKIKKTGGKAADIAELLKSRM